MPYLEVQKNNNEEDINTSLVEMPNVTGMTVEEAKKVLKELGLEITIEGEEEYITDQLPKKGIQINTGTKVIVYSN